MFVVDRAENTTDELVVIMVGVTSITSPALVFVVVIYH